MSRSRQRGLEVGEPGGDPVLRSEGGGTVQASESCDPPHTQLPPAARVAAGAVGGKVRWRAQSALMQGLSPSSRHCQPLHQKESLMTVYARPGSADALMAYESRYGNFIGGEWVPPSGGEYFENPTPVTGQAFCEIPRSTEADIDKALDAAHGAATAWGKTAAGERAADPQQDRRPHRGQPRVARAGRGVGQRQADPRDAGRRHAVGRRPLPLFRGRHPRAGGFAVPDRRGHRRLPLPRAARRRRADHPVELPDPDGHLEAGAGAGRGQRRGAQARRADPGLDPVPDVV